MIDNILVHHFGRHDQAVTLPVVLSGFDGGRHHVRAWAAHEGSIAQDLLLPIEGNEVVTEVCQLNESDWHAATMYFLMVDRFVDGDQVDNEPVENAASGLKPTTKAEIYKAWSNACAPATFDDLGMNTVDLARTQRRRGLGDCGKTAPAPKSPANSAGTTVIGP